MGNKMFYVTEKGANIARYNNLEAAQDQAWYMILELGKKKIEIVDENGALYFDSDFI
ncbi:hypothetical protein JDPAHGNP_00142 [Escherichia phage S127 BCL3]|nr:hypothetical protein JDPAHGNP_00142 [Escherichia phage S127 BCL3]